MMKKRGALSALAFVLFWCATASAQLTGAVGGSGTLAVELKFPEKLKVAWTTVQPQLSDLAVPSDSAAASCAAPESLVRVFWTRSRAVETSMVQTYQRSVSVLVTGLPEYLTAKFASPSASSKSVMPLAPIGNTHPVRITPLEDQSGIEKVHVDLVPGTYSFGGFGINTESGTRWWVDPFTVTVDSSTVKQTVTLQAKILVNFIPAVTAWNSTYCFGGKARECLESDAFAPGTQTRVVYRSHQPMTVRVAPAFTFVGCSEKAKQEFLNSAMVTHEQYAGYENIVQCAKTGAQETVSVVQRAALQPLVAVYKQTVIIDPKTGQQTPSVVQTSTLRVNDPITLEANTLYAFEARVQCLKELNSKPQLDVPLVPTSPAPKPKKPSGVNGTIVPATP